MLVEQRRDFQVPHAIRDARTRRARSGDTATDTGSVDWAMVCGETANAMDHHQ